VTKQTAFLVAVFVAPNLVSAIDRGFCVGASVGEKVTLESNVAPSPGAGVEDRSYKLCGGMDIGKHLAVELAHHDLGTQHCCDASVADWGYRIDVVSYSASVLAKLPIGRCDLFATLGYRFWDESGSVVTIAGPQPYSEHPSDLVAGAGADLRMTDHLAVRVEWEYFRRETDRWNVIGGDDDAWFAGLRYEF
jgi:opacity protein-like surface antigen